MTTRLPITKTHKLLINGAYVRSESGRSIEASGADGTTAHLCRASRKDLREAVVAARGALKGWMNRTAYNRGQILYRLSEMLEGNRAEFENHLDAAAQSKGSSTKGKRSQAQREVDASIDRLIAYAGWADKFGQVLGCNNAVAGPYYNFTVPEATGVMALVAPDVPPLLGLVTLIAPAICCGCTVVALASEKHPISACLLAEVCGVSDVPAGVVNILTGFREELLTHMAEHRDIDAIHAAGVSKDHGVLLRSGAAENLKRVRIHTVKPTQWYDEDACEGPWWIEPMVEMKTIWHPSAT